MGSGVGEPLQEDSSIRRKGITVVDNSEALKELLATRSKGKAVVKDGQCIAKRFSGELLARQQM